MTFTSNAFNTTRMTLKATFRRALEYKIRVFEKDHEEEGDAEEEDVFLRGLQDFKVGNIDDYLETAGLQARDLISGDKSKSEPAR
jgi:hypothetical protein